MPTPDMSLWQGRDDTTVEGPAATRIHQCVLPWSETSPAAMTLLGFACDEGVRRNQGRVGAASGPETLRKALANLAWPNLELLYDAGDVGCRDRDLERAQEELADAVHLLLKQEQKVIVLGGGHETAWGSFTGLASVAGARSIGVINLDAHFDLRMAPEAHSGTPFLQMAKWCQQRGRPFHYLCLGIAEQANTEALFQTARRLQVRWRCDHELAPWGLQPALDQLRQFLAGVDLVYLSVDLDVLPGSVMPAVSAPAAAGVSPQSLEALIQWIAGSGKLALADVVEFNPTYDREGLAARVAARLIWQLARHWFVAPAPVWRLL